MSTKSERTAGLVPVVKCIAHRSNGTPCANRPMKGQNVCKNHGGAAPAARQKAAERILLAQDLAAAKLVELMNDPTVPASVQRMAAADLLDRGGNVAAHVLAIPGVGTEQPWLSVFTSIAGGTRAESRMARGLDPGTIVDAEVIGEDALDMLDSPAALPSAVTVAPQPDLDRPERRPAASEQGAGPLGATSDGQRRTLPPNIVGLDNQPLPPEEQPRRFPTERNRAITPPIIRVKRKRR